MRATWTLILCLVSAAAGAGALFAGLQNDRDIGWLTYANYAENVVKLPRLHEPEEPAPFPDLIRRAEQTCPTLSRASGLSFVELTGGGWMLRPRPVRYLDWDRLRESWDALGWRERLRVALFGMTERASASISSAIVTKEDERSLEVRTRLSALLSACGKIEARKR
jgi:hypothetical protein